MTRSRMIPAVIAGLAIVGSGAVAPGRDERAPRSPREEGALLPRPPRQDEPWTPPRSDLPDAMVDAARLLFEQGLADPRGCAYRQVELVGEAEAFPGRVRTAPTHAFVIPFDVAGGPRYAVAWNGLVYPVARLGPAADLDDDIEALKDLVDPIVKGGPPRARQFHFTRDPIHEGRGDSDIETASQGDLAPTKVVLLLRLGRADLAGVVWKAGTRWPITDKPDEVPDFYANLAVDWIWALFGRAAMAHARGDDPLALATLRELARVRPLIAKRAPEKAARPDAWFPDILEQFPRFLADQERRARERSRAPVPGRHPHDRDARIAAMIRDLDEIRGGRWPQRYDLTCEPIVQELIAEGDAAVGPLIDCLEHDDRLTRSVHTREDLQGVGGGLGSGSGRLRYLVLRGVDWPAYLALTKILGTNDFGPWPWDVAAHRRKPTRAEQAARIRDYWERNRGLSAAERAFQTLADDTATQDRWLRAAEGLVHPDGDRNRAEALRARAHPSVTELMARRCQEMDPPGAQPVSATDVHEVNGMAALLAEWDRKASLPILAIRANRTAAVLGHTFSRLEGDDRALALDIVRLTRLRAEAGDPAALDDYAAWARTIRPPSFGRFPVDVFEPLWTYPDHPAIVAATRALFDAAASPWVPLLGPGDRGWGEFGATSDILCSPMLGVPEFRAKVLARLKDERTAVALGPVRLCDKVARKLSEIWGFPRFELYWTRAERDRAIAEAVALLSRHGDRLQAFDSRRWSGEAPPARPTNPRAVLVLPALDRPATPDDVSAGRAIFAAPAGSESRTWPMPERPMMSIWTTRPIPDDEPSLQPYRGRPELAGMTRNLRWGVVWQAEEVREGSLWRRYYGFVGHHAIARVPAEEIDFPIFPTRWGAQWYRISRDLDGRLVPPGGRDDGRMIRTDPVPVGGPLPIVVSLRNHRGIAATAPTDLARPGGVPALRAGVSIRVSRAPDPVRRGPVAGLSRGAPEPAPWPEVAPRREPGRYRSEAVKTLQPTETDEVLRLDLRELFELDRPGRYLVEVGFEAIRAEEGKPARISANFDLK